MKDGVRLIVVSSRGYSDLPEKGESIRVDENGNVLAKFIDGNLDCSVIVLPSRKDEPTLTPVA